MRLIVDHSEPRLTRATRYSPKLRARKRLVGLDPIRHDAPNSSRQMLPKNGKSLLLS